MLKHDPKRARMYPLIQCWDGKGVQPIISKRQRKLHKECMMLKVASREEQLPNHFVSLVHKHLLDLSNILQVIIANESVRKKTMSISDVSHMGRRVLSRVPMKYGHNQAMREGARTKECWGH